MTPGKMLFGDDAALELGDYSKEDYADHVDRNHTIDRTHDVPAFAGSSNDNKTVFIDRHIPETVNFNGQSVDLAKYLAVHETVEHKLMVEHNIPYAQAHIRATAAERAAVEADGVDWKSYEGHIDGMLPKIEKEPIVNPPNNLYLKVYHTTAWGNEASKIQAGIRRHDDSRL